MLWLVLLPLFHVLLCTVMSVGSLVYMFVLWSLSSDQPQGFSSNNTNLKVMGSGLSELERLPGVEDGGLVKGKECAVCLDDIEEGQPARVLPVCRHAFHRHCADAWLLSSAVCPLCRAQQMPPPLPPEVLPEVEEV